MDWLSIALKGLPAFFNTAVGNNEIQRAEAENQKLGTIRNLGETCSAYEVLYNWLNGTKGKQHKQIPLALRTKEVQINKSV